MNRKHTRISAWAACAVLMAATLGCETLKLKTEDLRPGPMWTTEGENAWRQHAVDTAIDPPLEQVWVYNAQAAFGRGSAIVLGDLILINTRKGEVHAITAEAGRKKGLKAFGESVEGMPVAEGDMLYVPIGLGRRSLSAYHLTRGEALWTAKTDPIEAGLLLTDEALIAADAEGFVRAYDKKLGGVLWEHDFGERRRFQATPLAVDDLIVAAGDKGVVKALNAQDGSVVWERDLQSPIYATPSTDGERLFLASTRGRFFTVDVRTGAPVWDFVVPDTTVYLGPPAYKDNQVVFGSSDKSVRAFDATSGDLIWKTDFPDALAAAPFITENVIYIGSMGRMLYGLDRENGLLVYEQELRGRIKSAMAARNDHLIVLAEPRHVYVFKPAATEYAVTE